MVKTRKSMEKQTVAENVPEPKVGDVAEEKSEAALPEDVVPKVVEEVKEIQEAPAVENENQLEAESEPKPEDNQQVEAESKTEVNQQVEAESKPDEKDMAPECDKQDNAVEQEKPTEMAEDVLSLKRPADEPIAEDEETIAAKKLKPVEGSEQQEEPKKVSCEE